MTGASWSWPPSSLDISASPAPADGRERFSVRGQDDRSFAGTAGIAGALRNCRLNISRHYRRTSIRGDLGRHGILHGRELAYDTRINSARAHALLLAVPDRARSLLRSLVDRRAAS